MSSGKLGSSRRPINTVEAFVRHHWAVIFLVALIFLLRWFISDHSYSDNEYLSVVVYGTDHKSALDAVRYLGLRSIHPPLFQFVLYHWVDFFGDSERAARALSNLYVCAAALVIYAFMLKFFGQRLAIATAVVLSLMYLPFLYGMVVRSYGQTLFFSCLSSFALISYMQSLKTGSWREVVANRWFFLLMVSNLALLLSHYYNAMFLAAQGLFLAAWYFYRHRLSVGSVLKLAVIGLTPVLCFLAIWGPTMVRSYIVRQERRRFELESWPSHNPLEIFDEYILSGNLILPNWALLVVSILGLAVIIHAIARLVRKRGNWRDVAVIYFAVALTLTPVVAYFLFLAEGHERYGTRFFIAVAPALAVLLALAIEMPFRILARLRPMGRAYLAVWPMVTLVAVGLLVVPASIKASEFEKVNVKVMAATINQLVTQNPDKKYILYQTSGHPMLDWYLERLGSPVRTKSFFSRKDDRNFDYPFDKQKQEIEAADFLIVTYTHNRLAHFPKLVKYLSEQYGLDQSMLNEGGRGMMIFGVH